MSKQSQAQIVKQQLRNKGEVSRNWCIRENYITRLGAIIDSLKKKGWKFETEQRGGDYIYKLVYDPGQFNEEVYDKKYIEQKQKEYSNPKLF